jgi:kynurenine formamidase
MWRSPLIEKSWRTKIPAIDGRILDLSLGIYDGAPTYKGFAKCSLTRTHTLTSDSFNLSKLTINTHGTTHLDAPSHFLETGKTVDQLNLSKCIGPALMINLSHKGPKDPVEVADLEAYAKDITPNSRVLMYFGWDKTYPEARYFTDHPYLSLNAAKWFASKGVGLLGFDIPTPNLDDAVEIHQILLNAEIVLVEALAKLDQLPPHGFLFMAVPLRILGCDGSPVRALAVV